jgi:hypothetical protein
MTIEQLEAEFNNIGCDNLQSFEERDKDNVITSITVKGMYYNGTMLVVKNDGKSDDVDYYEMTNGTLGEKGRKPASQFFPEFINSRMWLKDKPW